MKERIKKALLRFSVIILLLPFLQQQLKIIDSGELHGFYYNAIDPQLTAQKWFDGTYQVAKNNYYNDNTGFRPDLVRLNSQISYTMFKELEYASTLVGKDNSLYTSMVINSWYGKDFMGYAHILDKMIKLKALQDTFAHLGKSLILVHTPCKAFYNSDCLPAPSEFLIRKPDNFLTVLHVGDSLGVNQINLNAWFVAMKNKTKEFLFSKQGIHWTVYGSILGGDSIIKYIEKLRNIKMLHPWWTKTEHTTQARDTDDDLAKILNLIFPLAPETFAYPEVHYTADATKTKPNIMYIGDSFVLNLIKNGMMQNVHNNWEFWYYFREVLDRDHPDDNYPKTAMNKDDWKNSVNRSDCIILMYTAHNMYQLGNGFIEQAYDFYFPSR